MKRSIMEETPNATPATSMIGSLTGSLSNISEADKAAFEAEKMKIYQQLDDKVGKLAGFPVQSPEQL